MSSTYVPDPDHRIFQVSYGDQSWVSGQLGSDVVNVGGISVRQTVGLSTDESPQFDNAPSDGLFGLAFNTKESVKGIKTFMDNAIASGKLKQPVFSVFLPSVRRFGGIGGEYLFGGIDNTKYSGELTYVPVTTKGYWQIHLDDVSINGVSLGQSSEGIIDTGTTLIIVSDAAARLIHNQIEDSRFDPHYGWIVPKTLKTDPGSVGFELGGQTFNVPFADLAYEDLVNAYCISGIQGGQGMRT